MSSTRPSVVAFRRAVLTIGLVCSGVAITASGCGGTIQHTPGFPQQHRAVADACSPTRPPGNLDAGSPDAGSIGGSNCKVDSDCTAGKNGRCMMSRVGLQCSYDQCSQDSDCTGGAVCYCDPGGNRCVAANCTTDSACNGLGCSPTFETSCGPFNGVQGYYCHTVNDTCLDDKDCKATGPGYCAFDPKVGHWACGYGICVG